MTVPQLNDRQFKEQFRLTRGSVTKVLNLITEEDDAAAGTPLRKILLLLLWYMGSMVSFRKVAILFGMSLGAAWSAVRDVTNRLVAIRDRIITVPGMADMHTILRGFAGKGVQGAIGAVDGCHIEILRPQDNEQAYVNRKGYHSINLMAVVDHRCRFIDICVGWPGSVHDSRVFRNSPLGRRLTQEHYRAQVLPEEAYIIGDAAFQLSTFMITPFRENQLRAQRHGEPTPQQKKHFNHVLSGARVVVEHTFGVLKSRFRRLSLVETKSVENAVHLVTAVCVLHNICIMNDDAFQDDEAAVNALVHDDEDGGADAGGADGAAAVLKRYRLVEEMWAAHARGQ